MHTIRIDFTDLPPGETDRLIAALWSYLREEPSEIHLEFRHREAGSRVLHVPAGPASVPSGHPGTLEIPFRQLIYAISDRHYCEIQTTQIPRRKRFRINFCEIRRQLPEDHFLTCGRGVILSMAEIRERSRDFFTMSDGTRFALPSRHRKEIIRQYEAFRTTHG